MLIAIACIFAMVFIITFMVFAMKFIGLMVFTLFFVWAGYELHKLFKKW